MFNKLLNKTIGFLGESEDHGLKTHEPQFSALKQFTNECLKHYRLSDLLPYQAFDPESGLFFNKQSAGFVLEISPMIGSGDEIDRQLTGIFQHLLPASSNIQFLMIASPKVQSFFDTWANPRQQCQEVFGALAKKRVEFLKSKVNLKTDKSAYCLRQFKVIISFSGPQKPKDALEIQKLVSLRSQIITTLEGAGSNPVAWGAGDLIQGLDAILNLNDRFDLPLLRWHETQDLASQMVSPETLLKVDKDTLLQQNGEKAMRCYTVRDYPSQWTLPLMGEFLGNDFNDYAQISMPFMMHYGVHVCGEKTLKTRMLAKCSQAERTANSPLAKWLPSSGMEAAEWGFVRDQFSSGQRLIRTRFQIILMGETQKMDVAEQQLVNLYRQNRFELSKDVYMMLPSLISALPMSWGEGMAEDSRLFSKTKTTLSHEAVNLLPIQGDWCGTESPGMLLASRKGQLFFWEPSDNNAGNFNVCVVGSSGAGKSVFMQELVTSTLGRSGRVFVLDVGRSFEKLANVLGGEFIEFSTRSPVCVNPFSNIPDDPATPGETEDALVMLKSIVCMMADPAGNLTPLQSSYIEKSVFAVWREKKQTGCVGDVSDHLLAQEDKIAQDLGHVLFPYSPQGSFGRFFTGKSTINLQSQFVVVELEELKGRKDLQSVIVQIVILAIADQIYLGDRKTVFRVVLDEAWDMLRGKQTKDFIEAASRRFRKYKGGLVVGTQSVNDFYANPGAQACFDNSDWLCMLAQKDESIDQLKKSGKLKINAHTERLLRSVKLKPGHYGEAMIFGPHGYAVARLLLDPFSNVLYSTKAEEYARVKDHQKAGCSIGQAIEKVSEENSAH